MGIDPEVEPAEGEPDLRPRTRTKAFVVYGDTDSVMVNFGDVILADCARLGAAAAKMCTEAMEAPNSLAFESIKLRSLYLNKKRYASLEILNIIPGERMCDAIRRAKMSIKGLEGKRRDNAPIGSDTQNEVIEILLREADVEKAERYVMQVIEDLMMDRTDMSKLVITKGLSKTEDQYDKGGSKQQHVELRKRIRKRAKYTGEAVPETGDRVPFIMKAGVNKKSGSKGADKASDLSEDPLFAQRNGIPINKEYYIHKQIWPAVIRVFTGVHEPAKCVMIDSNMNMSARQTLKAHQRLFGSTLPHMLHKKVRKTRTFGMGAFVKALPKCLGCGIPLKGAQQVNPCCGSCDADRIQADMAAELANRKRAREEAWDTCRNCAGGGFEEVTCQNMTCTNFFHRERTIIDIEDLEKDYVRFKRNRPDENQ
jgi:DNA polymerase delta subunit 1